MTSACWMPAAYCPSPHVLSQTVLKLQKPQLQLLDSVQHDCSSILRNQTNEDDWPAGFCFQIYLQMDWQNLALRPSSVEMLTPATGTGRSSLTLGDDSWRAAHLNFTEIHETSFSCNTVCIACFNQPRAMACIHRGMSATTRRTEKGFFFRIRCILGWKDYPFCKRRYRKDPKGQLG